MSPILNKNWVKTSRVREVEVCIAEHLGIEAPKLFLHPMHMLVAMAMERKREIVLDLHVDAERQFPGFLTLKVTEKAGEYTCYCKVEAFLVGQGHQDLYEAVVKNIEKESALKNMMMDVRAVFRQHRLKLR